MKRSPLGVFDSGVGGLTVVKAIQALLPCEDVVYLGDTARLPYGSKSPDTIRQFSDEDVRFLVSKGVKAIVVACNTATAHALPSLQAEYEVPIIGVVVPGVDAALADPDADRFGIIATRGTIDSHVYQHALATRRTGVIIHGVPTPLLVPLIEENWLEEDVTKDILKKYLQPLIERNIDTLLLGCTHYPLLVPALRELLPDHVRLVDSATTCAERLKEMLSELDLLCEEGKEDGSLQIFLTDLSEQFEELAKRFLNKDIGRIRRGNLVSR
ncbi:MAG: glutamate racemase [Akkermansiaceae bacterium]